MCQSLCRPTDDLGGSVSIIRLVIIYTENYPPRKTSRPQVKG